MPKKLHIIKVARYKEEGFAAGISYREPADLSAHQLDHRHDHFLQAYTAMLKSIPVIIHIVIVIIGIAEKHIFAGKYIR